MPLYRVYSVDSVGKIPRDAWDRLANPAELPYDPFLSYDFFLALEESSSASALTGWGPLHLVVEALVIEDCEDEASDDDNAKVSDEDNNVEVGEIVGIMPLYSKPHSKGEYIFDHGWAEGFEMAGGRYYPKLLCAIPFTPVTGRRIFVGGPEDGTDASAITSLLLDTAVRDTELGGHSSVHINFIEEGSRALMQEKGFLIRSDVQFHWRDDGYKDFDNFLSSLQSRKRKSIRKERRSALSAGIEVEWIEGSAIGDEHWDAFFEFYLDTGFRKWGHPYLTRAFFEQIGVTLKDDIVLIMAKLDGRYIAGALNLKGSDTLYGRYWGTIEHHDFLHFEICYYQAIDYALANGLSRVEAGAQGQHKLLRGYCPVTTYSAHYIAHKGLRGAVENFIDDESRVLSIQTDILKTHLPFKKDN